MVGWRCFRKERHDPYHLNLEQLKDMVDKRLGKENAWRFLTVPLSLGMPETFQEKYQAVTETSLKEVTFLGAADKLGFNVVGVSPLMSGLLAQTPLPTSLAKTSYLVPKHLNLIRSLPFESILTVVYGARVNRHVKINLATSYAPHVPTAELDAFLRASRTRKQEPEKPVNFESGE
jgi:hypothetical protein